MVMGAGGVGAVERCDVAAGLRWGPGGSGRCQQVGTARRVSGVHRRTAVGALVGPYLIVEELGRGGMSVVYRGAHAFDDRPAAIKVLPPEIVDDAEALELLRVEAMALSAIAHPGVVALYEHGRAPEVG